MIERLPIAGCGFLLAVLWFDLMFDALALTAPPGMLAEERLAAISAYYARVTTAADPMGRFVGVVMITTLAALMAQLWRGRLPRAPAALSFALVLAPVSLALLRILPDAARLGARADPLDVQSELARSIGWEHCACLAAVIVALALQLWIPGRARAAPP